MGGGVGGGSVAPKKTFLGVEDIGRGMWMDVTKPGGEELGRP